MKTKRTNLLLIALTLLLMTNCKTDFPIEQLSEEKAKKETTIERQEMTKDTLIVSFNNDEIYVFDENNVMTYKIYTYNWEKCWPVRAWWVLLSWVFSFMFIIMMIGKLFDL